ncbi:MAG: bifunctional 5,10-methylenetetrahydrofolate dehydrogenase/5,10-methenyltetrahydrofolate cyclohydrolase [Patescibacteria group bacterium]|nr:bifunctional 5,10-methylenetetrahydrofolate dehydrogenase/5,10-methenyltetrahydrofolate cyclohydrolase [Patescibacteria group bacterium]
MIIDGKKIANEIIETLARERSTLPPVLRLGVLMGKEDAASASFVKIKERVADKLQVVTVRELLGEAASTAQALRSVERLADRCEGIIIQLPLPSRIDIEEVLRAVPPKKDVDAINPNTQEPLVLAPVAAAIAEIFIRENVSGQNKKAVVVGAGRLVGAPAAALLKDMGASVSVITQTKGSLKELKDADLVVLGAGESGLVKPKMLKEGVVLIDAGTSALPADAAREQGVRVAGDADPRCAEAASIFTPVPGGVGPIAVAMIFKNLFTLARRG